MGFPGGFVVKNLPASECRRHVFDSCPGRSPGEGNGNPVQYSCLQSSMDRGAWWTAIHGVAKCRIQSSDWTTTMCTKLHFPRHLITLRNIVASIFFPFYLFQHFLFQCTSTPQELQVTTSTWAWSLAQVAHISVSVWTCLCALLPPSPLP